MWLCEETCRELPLTMVGSALSFVVVVVVGGGTGVLRRPCIYPPDLG